MTQRLTDKLVDVLTVGNRPLRIFIFGGALLAYFIMKLLGKIIGVDTNIGGDIDLPNAILMVISIPTGYAVSYGIMRLLENSERQRKEDVL